MHALNTKTTEPENCLTLGNFVRNIETKPTPTSLQAQNYTRYELSIIKRNFELASHALAGNIFKQNTTSQKKTWMQINVPVEATESAVAAFVTELHVLVAELVGQHS